MRKTSSKIQERFYKNLYENYEELSGFFTSVLDSQYRDMEEIRGSMVKRRRNKKLQSWMKSERFTACTRLLKELE